MAQRVMSGLLVVAVAVLGYVAYAQHERMKRLDAEIDALRARPSRSLALTWPSAKSAPAPVAVAPPAAAEPVPAEPRADVSKDEIARVESAVLSLLESDRPELRAKLQAAVQQEHRAVQQQQRDARRERWAARRELRLRELSETAGVTPEQREAILTIMLANRDQIDELRREAVTPEAIATVKDRVRALRDQADAQIRKQLRPEQYEAYQNQFDRDDD